MTMMTAERPRVAFVCQPWESLRPPVRSGSLPIWTYQVARRLADRADIHVLSARAGQHDAGRDAADGISYVRVPVRLDGLVQRLLRRLPRRQDPTKPLFWSRLHDAAYCRGVANQLRRLAPDIIHIHNFAPFARVFRAACPAARIVLHMHCDWLAQLDPALTARYLESVDLVIGCSDHVARAAAARFPGVAARTVWNGADLDHFPVAPYPEEGEAVDILFVGRLSPEKGIHVLCEAFNRVAERHGRAHLVLVGPVAVVPRELLVDLDENPQVRALSRFYPDNYAARCREILTPAAARRTVFTGSVPHQELGEYYRRAALLINPSLSESFGMSLLEAAAHGRPVVASRIGGMPEVVSDDETGILCEPDDAWALAGAMLDLLSDRDRAWRMGLAGRHRAEQLFRWEHTAETLWRCYSSLGWQASS